MNTPTPLQSLPPQPIYPGYQQINRTAGPVKVLGILYAVLAGLSVFGFIAMIVLATVPGLLNHDPDNPAATFAPAILFGAIAVFIGIGLLLHATTAYGLLTLKPWGRTFAIVTAIITCLSIPIGTILGVFTLYFLLRQAADQEYAHLAAARIPY